MSGFWGGGVLGVGSLCMISQQLARTLGVKTHPTQRQRSVGIGGDVHMEVSDVPLEFRCTIQEGFSHRKMLLHMLPYLRSLAVVAGAAGHMPAACGAARETCAAGSLEG